MQFIGIEIGINGTHASVLDLDSAEILAEVSVSHSWIEGLPVGFREQEPNQENHELYLDLMARQQYLVNTLHPAGFL